MDLSLCKNRLRYSFWNKLLFFTKTFKFKLLGVKIHMGLRISNSLLYHLLFHNVIWLHATFCGLQQFPLFNKSPQKFGFPWFLNCPIWTYCDRVTAISETCMQGRHAESFQVFHLEAHARPGASRCSQQCKALLQSSVAVFRQDLQIYPSRCLY